MQRIAIWAAPPAGEPPPTDPVARSVSVQAAGADGSNAGIDPHLLRQPRRVHERVDVHGDRHDDVRRGGRRRRRRGHVGEGTLRPSAGEGLLHGAVIWRVTGGRGRFAGASGLIASNFLLSPQSGDVDEWQSTVLFVP